MKSALTWWVEEGLRGLRGLGALGLGIGLHWRQRQRWWAALPGRRVLAEAMCLAFWDGQPHPWSRALQWLSSLPQSQTCSTLERKRSECPPGPTSWASAYKASEELHWEKSFSHKRELKTFDLIHFPTLQVGKLRQRATSRISL